MLLPAKEIKKIVILRALQLGDVLCSVPAFRALRNAYPNAGISIIGLPWMQIIPERFPHYIDEFILFPGYPGLPEQDYNTREIIKFIECIQEREFDLALQMQGKRIDSKPNG